MEGAVQRVENRREGNRQSARRHYHKKKVRRRDRGATCGSGRSGEVKLSADRPFLRYDYPAKSSQYKDDTQDAIETLQRDNAALRKRLGQFLSWEKHLNESVNRTSLRSSHPKQARLDQPQDEIKQTRIKFKSPLTVEKCHSIVREVYSEIATFNTSGREGWISTGASVFGWTDQRRVDNGLLKFSLSKVNIFMSPEEDSAAGWNILTTPGGYEKIFSPNFGMRTEIVQVVDHSNVVIWQEHQVHGSSGGVPTVTVVRALVLITLFATDEGYIILLYGLDPELVTLPPNDYLTSLEDDYTIVNYAWQPVFNWATYNRVEGAPNQCLASLMGTMRVEGANLVNWAVEVLLVVLRFESIVLGSSGTLLPTE